MKIRVLTALGMLLSSGSVLAGVVITPVSEPGILGLVGAGALAGALAWRIRRRR
ncbi:MAG: PEP-CTERM sorting domain-containing protein [Chromatiales bacterium]|nr:PEP-CTERM sorting domain-containing protein [Chromatiales bacterium]